MQDVVDFLINMSLDTNDKFNFVKEEVKERDETSDKEESKDHAQPEEAGKSDKSIEDISSIEEESAQPEESKDLTQQELLKEAEVHFPEDDELAKTIEHEFASREVLLS
jgi:hypothetical protein